MNHVPLSPKTLLMGVGLAAAMCSAAFGQAANDECSTAEVAILGVPAAFDTTNASPSPEPVDDAQCAGTFLNWGTSNPDVWFRWTPSADVTVVVTTCDAASFDTSLVIYSGSCDGLTQVACNGDGAGQTGCQDFYSAITLNATANTTYYIRIGGYTPDGEPSETGAGTLSLIEFTAWQYVCSDPAPGISNDCATSPVIISADGTQSYFGANAQNVLCNTDGPPHAGAVCASGSDDLFLDRWYRVTAPATGSLRVWTSGGQPDCASTADLKLAVYDMGTVPSAFDYNELPNVLVTCNDDGGPCADQGFGSEVSATVVQGRTYLVRVGYFSGDDVLTTVPQVVNFDLPETCPLQSFSVGEDEPCGEDLNGGCNTDAAFPPVQVVNVGDVIGGTFFSSATSRDTDWYQFTVNAPTQVTVTMNSRVPGTVFIFDAVCVPGTEGPGGTPGQTLAVSSPTAFCPISASACLTPGTYRCVVVPAFQELACGSDGQSNDYRLSITGAPAACPTLVAATCADPGPDTQVIGLPDAAPFGGLVACAVNPAAPDCGGGGTTRNRFARVIPANQVLDELSCLSIGVFSIRRQTSEATGACVNFASDVPLPATIGIYRDENGGAPTNTYAADGTCPDGNCDMVLVNEFQVLIPGGAYKGVLNFPTPICLEDVPAGQNLVVVMDIPDLNAGVPGIPAASGYGLRPAGNTVAGDTPNTYCRLSCADAAGAYVLTTSLGATFTANWALELNGTAVGCGGSACPADLNDDDFVNGDDLGILLGAWGQCSGATCPADFNEDGFVNGDDLGVMLGAWGQCAG
jgi:hypothetical protein